MKPNHYIGEVIETDDGELVIEIPSEIINQMGWDEQTLLEWLVEEEQLFLREAEQ